MISQRVISLFIRTAALVPFIAQVAVIAQTVPVTPVSATQVSVPQTLPVLSEEERGDVYMARKMFREAIASYKNGPPKSALLANKIGIAWHNLGELNLARSSYERAAKLDKTYAEAINNAGTIFYAQKRFGTAIRRYKRAIELSPGRASFWSNLGTAYYSQGKFPLMMEAYSKAISLDPEIFEHRGFSGTEVQDRTVADRARYHFELARLYAKIGREALAMQYLRHSLEEGFKDKDKVRKAPEFAALLEKPEFIELMALEPRVL